MPAAYDVEGRLKKHALLGTSLAVDPYRKEQREKFKSLYGEAKSAAGQGIGREGMIGRLQTRWQEFGQPQMSRLGEIAREKGTLQTEAAGLGDVEKEARFSEYEKWIAQPSKAIKSERFKRLAKGGIPQEFLDEAKKEYDSLSKLDKDIYAKEHEINPTLGAFAKYLWAERYGTPAQQAYKEQISAEVDKLQGRYQTLEEEEMERQEKLRSRAEFYNMFLGV